MYQEKKLYIFFMFVYLFGIFVLMNCHEVKYTVYTEFSPAFLPVIHVAHKKEGTFKLTFIQQLYNKILVS